jgi:hypothetical protein
MVYKSAQPSQEALMGEGWCRWDKWTGDAMIDLLELETSLGMLDGRTGACQWQKPDLAAAALLR